MPGTDPLKIVINSREYDYVSDYPDGWKFSAGDPYKYPVSIGGNPCFIKRFEQKSPEDISGWDVLVKISGKYEKNLSRVYDIKNVEEDGKEIYYVFYEYLDGSTLDKTIKDGAPVNLGHLNTDLFNAIRALQKYEYWFADFTEKNIFSQMDGSYVLVDVDSTQKISDVPDNDMYGSKDYWILVLKFYKEILGKNDLRLSDINGITLNYLQIPFLILRLKLLAGGNARDYNATELFSQLPAKLNGMAPGFKDIYSTVIRNGNQPLSVEDIAKAQDLVDKKIINSDYVPEVAAASVSLPLIKAFTTSSKEVESGGAFTLSWQVENANKLELYKNGARFQALQVSQKDVTLKEFADGTRQQSTYQLIAYNDLEMAKSDPIIIELKDGDHIIIPDPIPVPTNWKRIITIGFVVLAIIIGAVFLFKKKPAPGGNTVSGPVSNAGADFSIKLPANSATLTGTGTDTDGTIKGYKWRQVSGPNTATFGNNMEASTQVNGLTTGTYVFRLQVTDSDDRTALDDINVTVVNADANLPPVIDSIGNQSVLWPRNSANLTGSAKDPDGTITSYSWAYVAGPGVYTLSPTSKSVNIFTATVTGLILGTYEFKLTVTDNNGVASSTTMLVYVITNKIRLPPDWYRRKTIEKTNITPAIKSVNSIKLK
jgi:hypothetical protein